jgi:molecular chaperone DnaK
LLLGGRVLDVLLTAGQVARATGPLLERGASLCEATLRKAGVAWTDLREVLLAGGGTMLPTVSAALRARSGLPAERFRSQQPQRAVVFGTALVAAGRAGLASSASSLLRRTAPADLGFRVMDSRTRTPVVDVLIPVGTPIPARKGVTYYSNRPDQTRMIFEVVQVAGQGDEPTSLGHFAFPLESPRKNHPLEVALGYDDLGLVTVQARDPESGRDVRREFGEAGLAQAGRLSEQSGLVEGVRLLV